MWDAAADGYTRGEGFAAVFLKTLSQAVADGDHVECIIRETGVNSDGKTQGITMPSSESQACLIRETYARCGLNPAYELDRPQYFEAHGTGTQAGDPIEARTIHNVFFPGQESGQLMVGSIKTVIGHTEGTAGIAGLLKASLAVQNGRIPANLHFKNLNSKIRPYYTNLRVPTETVAWPEIPHGCSRRVSVNSFGFGGTNAHAIVESYDGPASLLPNGHTVNGQGPDSAITEARGVWPFVLSANSATALSASAHALAGYLRTHGSTDLERLAYTLFRRTDFSFRTAFSATSVEQLVHKLESNSQSLKNTSRTAVTPHVAPPRILGVFTGQGAQWAAMGKELLSVSVQFRRAMDHMQQSLDSLPAKDRPGWTLIDQMNAPAEESRLGEAIVSQPLCTALQVALVDVLHAAGLRFSAVVGHSSGEIGAAYAAGYLDARDAVRVAYYRGVHSHLALGPGGKRGKMMAVGMSLEQATAFCTAFDGSLTVAASNSETSCTLAGDAEAIEDANARLHESGMFARVLQVDTAYHSHHMKACGAPYLESMSQCGVQVRKGRKHCRWFSSVWGSQGRSRSFDQADCRLLEGSYWVDNMTGAVLYREALARAISEDHCFDIALEIGPHPALKGPSSETIKVLTGLSLPYTGVLKRGQNSAESLVDALGLIWRFFPSSPPMITFAGMQKAFATGRLHHLAILKNLPTYPWDHSGLIWKESRTSRGFRVQNQSRHELLGHSITHGERDKREVHWKQILRLNELPWLEGHRIQGEVLFPASGYLAMAYEAATRLVDSNQPLRLVELHNVDIVRAMRLEEDSSGLEVVFSIRIRSQSNDCIAAEVACYSGSVDAAQPLDVATGALTAHFTGGVRLWLGQPDKDVLPARNEPSLPMDTLDMSRLYSSLSQVGFNYTKLFRATSMRRRLNHAVVDVSSPPETSSIRPCMHPALIDTGFQGLLAAFSFPEDGRLGSIYLPTRVDCVRISMMPSESHAPPLTADAIVTWTNKTTLKGNLDLFDGANARTEVQLRGVHLTAVGQPRERWLYAGVTWGRDVNYGIEPGTGARLSDAECVLYEQLIRTAHFYLRQLRQKIRPQELLLMGKYRKHMMTWVSEHLLPQIDAGKHPEIRPEWVNDTREMVEQWRASYPPNNNDMNILHAMGSNLISIVRGILPPLRVLTQDNMLDRLYVEGIGVQHGNVDLGAIVSQLSHQYPRMKILEVGAGTGGTTRTVLAALSNRYMSYTYSDISTGFFDNARSVFSQHISKLIFKTLNIENDAKDQGFTDGAFDLIISSNCLHATKSLANTLQRCRQLLRPGGRLILLEVTRDFLPTQLIMSTLPGWFLGIEDGRVWAPTVSVERWDELLKDNGFSGVDFSSSPSYCSVIMAQAVDETVRCLRTPLSFAPAALASLNHILIVGDGASSRLATETQEVLQAAVPRATNISIVPGLEGIEVPARAAVLCLSDLQCPVFRNMNQKKFKGLQDVMGTADVVLWVTTGAKSGKDPDANITLGLSSTLLGERMNLRLQFLDVDHPSSADASTLAKMLLRNVLLDPSKNEELLWTQEPELTLKNGAMYIPRVLSLDPINRRSAARLRQVTQTTSLGSKETPVIFDERQGALEVESAAFVDAGENEIFVQVTASSFGTLDCDGCGPMHMCIGKDLSSGDKVLALANAHSSFVKAHKTHVLTDWQLDKAADDDDAKVLSLFLRRILAERLLDGITGPSWVHGAPDDLREAIGLISSERGIVVSQSTSDMARASGVKFIHPYSSDNDLRGLWPKDLQSFVDVSGLEYMSLDASICASLPDFATKKQVTKLTAGLKIANIRDLAKQYLRGYLQGPTELLEIVAMADISTEKSRQLGPTAVVDWTTADTVNALVRPLEHRGLFSSEKTYLLCGMTGDLGISVSLWMVEHGARNVVLTSRNPNVSVSVLEYFSRRGANVKSIAADISNMDSLRCAYLDIQSSMPPIGGVMNAAMVLRDRLFHTVPWEDFAAVLAPKVTGSKNLDHLFADQELDFFICFSSTTSIIGSIGQSAYAAANHYMASLVQGRRERGLAGSVIYISVLTGFGYIFRRDSTHADTIYKSLLSRCERQSETDLHEMLAEAIICGRPSPNQKTELITGIRRIFEDERREDPRLSGYSGQQGEQEAESSEKTHAIISVGVQLAAAEDPVECLDVLVKCFSFALGNLLELDPEKLDNNSPVSSLGIDSLVAIRIREWFLREIGVDVPVLKIMSDTHSMLRLCEDVLVDWRRLDKVEEIHQ